MDGETKNVWYPVVATASGGWSKVRISTGEQYAYDTPEQAAGCVKFCYFDLYLRDRLDRTCMLVGVLHEPGGEVEPAWRYA